MQVGNPTRQIVPAPEPLSGRFNEQRAIAPQLGESPLLPIPFFADTTPQQPMASRSGMKLPATPATPGTPKTVAVNPLDFPTD